eukprot:403372655
MLNKEYIDRNKHIYFFRNEKGHLEPLFIHDNFNYEFFNEFKNYKLDQSTNNDGHMSFLNTSQQYVQIILTKEEAYTLREEMRHFRKDKGQLQRRDQIKIKNGQAKFKLISKQQTVYDDEMDISSNNQSQIYNQSVKESSLQNKDQEENQTVQGKNDKENNQQKSLKSEGKIEKKLNQVLMPVQLNKITIMDHLKYP